MAVVKIPLDISVTGRCLAIYRALSDIGLVSSVVGTPNYYNFVFSTPLVDSAYHLRFRMYDYTTYMRALCCEIGTVSGSTFTPIVSIAPYVGNQARSPSYFYLTYDVSVPWILLSCDPAGYGHHIFLGKTAAGHKIGLSLISQHTDQIGSFVNLSDLSSYGGIWTFFRNVSYNNQILEQTLKIIDTGGNILMNGSNPDEIVGVKNVSLEVGQAYTELGNAILFGARYITGTAVAQSLWTYLKIDMT